MGFGALFFGFLLFLVWCNCVPNWGSKKIDYPTIITNTALSKSSLYKSEKSGGKLGF